VEKQRKATALQKRATLFHAPEQRAPARPIASAAPIRTISAAISVASLPIFAEYRRTRAAGAKSRRGNGQGQGDDNE
jgi:hypothetical protein